MNDQEAVDFVRSTPEYRICLWCFRLLLLTFIMLIPLVLLAGAAGGGGAAQATAMGLIVWFAMTMAVGLVATVRFNLQVVPQVRRTRGSDPQRAFIIARAFLSDIGYFRSRSVPQEESAPVVARSSAPVTSTRPTAPRVDTKFEDALAGLPGYTAWAGLARWSLPFFLVIASGFFVSAVTGRTGLAALAFGALVICSIVVMGWPMIMLIRLRRAGVVAPRASGGELTEVYFRILASTKPTRSGA